MRTPWLKRKKANRQTVTKNTACKQSIKTDPYERCQTLGRSLCFFKGKQMLLHILHPSCKKHVKR